MVCARSAAEMPVVTPSRASMDSQNAVPNCEVFSRGHQAEAQVLQPLLGQRQADQSAPVLRHEIDGFGRDFLGRHGQVAFVFAVFVVHHHHHPPLADLVDGGLDIAEWGSLGHRCDSRL